MKTGAEIQKGYPSQADRQSVASPSSGRLIMAEAELWWPPREISFKARQVKWLISVLPVLREGLWPPCPRESGYLNAAPRRMPPRVHAPFETAALVAAELDVRIRSCGMDGWLVKAVYGWGENYVSLGLSDKELFRRVMRCLKYITGWKRKRVSYRDFVNHRRKETGYGQVEAGCTPLATPALKSVPGFIPCRERVRAQV
jgi:hypothetical protein